MTDTATAWVNATVLKWARRWLTDMVGKQYVFGAEVQPGQAIPAPAIDCSELTERLFNDVCQVPLPDGSYNQYEYCRKNGHQISLEEAGPLDLVFLWNADLKQIGHVGVVYGDLPEMGAVIVEARGKPYDHVIITPLAKFAKAFGPRFAGVWRIQGLSTTVDAAPTTPA